MDHSLQQAGYAFVMDRRMGYAALSIRADYSTVPDKMLSITICINIVMIMCFY